MTGRIVSINISGGGVPKRAVEEADVRSLGIVGDVQRNRQYHGGPDRALCLYSMDWIDALRAEGHPIAPGTTGENVTVHGVDWALLVPGIGLHLGAVHVEVTGFASPCYKIQSSFLDSDSRRIDQRRHPGWSRVYCRVLRPGPLRQGDVVVIEPASS
ncbi:MAG: MOSC domain-containing protein [Acidobacteria bacterium]|nr:MAG: MOSC domain-containing protein [Acidobacteriota bacterium]